MLGGQDDRLSCYIGKISGCEDERMAGWRNGWMVGFPVIWM